ncbi:MAG: T9SS type B sorting domain-containing protein [Crocinitomix sp.]|nr:T9SS type B sorting domain-containing protein [Crocinitomix sp.]
MNKSFQLKNVLPYSILIIVCLFTKNGNAQNLVPNFSFEIFDSTNLYEWPGAPGAGCPMNTYGQDWFDTPNCPGTVQAFSNVLPAPYTAPNNGISFSYGQHEDSYIGIMVYQVEVELDNRTVANVKLIDTLNAGEFYEVSFHYKLAYNDWDTNPLMSIDNLGALFTADTASCWELSNLSPDVRTEPSVIQDNIEWKKYTGLFRADGDETFLALGCIGPRADIEVEYTPPLYTGAYYYFDSVSVSHSNIGPADVFWDLEPNVFSPNGDEINEVYEIDYFGFESIEVNVLNRWGNLVKRYDAIEESWNGTNQNGQELSDGVYFLSFNGRDFFGKGWTGQQTVTIVR